MSISTTLFIDLPDGEPLAIVSARASPGPLAPGQTRHSFTVTLDDVPPAAALGTSQVEVYIDVVPGQDPATVEGTSTPGLPPPGTTRNRVKLSLPDPFASQAVVPAVAAAVPAAASTSAAAVLVFGAG